MFTWEKTTIRTNVESHTARSLQKLEQSGDVSLIALLPHNPNNFPAIFWHKNMSTRADAATPWIQRLSGPRFRCNHSRTTKGWITPQIELNHHGRRCTSVQNWDFSSRAQINIGTQCPWQIGQAGAQPPLPGSLFAMRSMRPPSITSGFLQM